MTTSTPSATAGDPSRLRRLTFVSGATTYLLVAVGGLVRATESGLGCGDDWPRCGGRVVPEGDHHTWIEFTHRAIALVLMILVVALAVAAWRTARRRPDVVRLAIATVPLVVGQAVLGAVVVALELHAESVVAHLGLAMALLAVILALAVRLTFEDRRAAADRVVARTVWTVAGAALGVMLLGSYMSGREAGLAFTDWPLFDGGLVPSNRGSLGWAHGLHRIGAGLGGVGVGMLVMWIRRRGTDRRVVGLVAIAGSLYAVQVVVGAANIWTELHAAIRATHLAVAAAVWGSLACAALIAGRVPAPTVAGISTTSTALEVPPRPIRQRARAYFWLTKPRVIELLLVTTVPAMVLAEGGMPNPALVGAVLLGGALAAGGANTINCYIDRERDKQMRRTSRRPLPAGEIDPVAALRFGLVLEAAAFAWLWWSANFLAAALAVAATVFYVFVYSIWLKPRTAQNIVVGGAAGAVPVLVGWAAVQNEIAPPAWVLFAIIFVWTPPHFWALAMRYRDDYAAAGVPMLPVVAGVDTTTRHIVVYAWIVVATTLLLWQVGELSALYLATAVGLGGAFVWRAARLRRDRTPGEAMRLFTFSNAYLALLFAAVAFDVLAVHGI